MPKLPVETSGGWIGKGICEISNLTKFRVNEIEITAGVVHLSGGLREIGWIHWGYPQYHPTYQLEPMMVYLKNPLTAYLYHLEEIRRSHTPAELQYYYDYAQTWRQVVKWAIQMGFNLNARTLQ